MIFREYIVVRIISGGQTGAEQAALDVAIEYGIPHGGWIPRGRKAEKGRLPDKYKLKELSTINYPKRTELNVIDSDGTLILSHGKLTDESAVTSEFARRHRKPCLHLDLDDITEYKAVEVVRSWIKIRHIRILNVAGPKASKDPEIYDATERVLKSVLFPPPESIAPDRPKTVDEALDTLLSKLSLQEKKRIAELEAVELPVLRPNMGRYIRDKFGLSTDNKKLMESCRFLAKKYGIQPPLDEDEASVIIIRELWKMLRQTHSIRVANTTGKDD